LKSKQDPHHALPFSLSTSTSTCTEEDHSYRSTSHRYIASCQAGAARERVAVYGAAPCNLGKVERRDGPVETKVSVQGHALEASELGQGGRDRAGEGVHAKVQGRESGQVEQGDRHARAAGYSKAGKAEGGDAPTSALGLCFERAAAGVRVHVATPGENSGARTLGPKLVQRVLGERLPAVQSLGTRLAESPVLGYSGVGVGAGLGVGFGVGSGEGFGVGFGMGLGVGFGIGLGVGVGGWHTASHFFRLTNWPGETSLHW
jgi:hypothetical protein